MIELRRDQQPAALGELTEVEPLFKAAIAASRLAHIAEKQGRDPSEHFHQKNVYLLRLALDHGEGMECVRQGKITLVKHALAPGLKCHTIPEAMSALINGNGHHPLIRASLRQIFGFSSGKNSQKKAETQRRQNRKKTHQR